MLRTGQRSSFGPFLANESRKRGGGGKRKGELDAMLDDVMCRG